MNGSERFLVDTNIFIFLVDGNRNVAGFLKDKILFYSFITEIELLGVPGITEKQKEIVTEILKNCIRIGFTDSVCNETIRMKQQSRIKIPDAIIACSAIENNLPLITADKGFTQMDNLDCVYFES